MSRRHSRTDNYDDIEVNPEPVNTGEVAWTDPIPGYNGLQWWQWQTAFADTTLDVVEKIWRRQGARLYRLHRDTWLRDDLRDWLYVAAQKLANRYIPNPLARDPERYWGGYLHKSLNDHAHWHFTEVVGDTETNSNAARVQAHLRGIVSHDELIEAEDAIGVRVNRHPLHGDDAMQRDPAIVITHLEDLDRENTYLEKYLRDNGTYSTSSRLPTGRPCLINLCTLPAHRRGLCTNHYEQEWNNREDRRTCNIPDCGKPHKALGLCAAHRRRLRNGTLPDGLHQYVQPSSKAVA